jgi:hypothetical protein
MKENWYELVYEDDERGEDYLKLRILYTSKKGLNSLITQLQIISNNTEPGRYQLEIEEMDDFYDAPFSHIEIAEKPIESSEVSEWYSEIRSWLIVLAVFAIPLFALYGLVRVIMDMFF